jgi:putative phosphoesterase
LSRSEGSRARPRDAPRFLAGRVGVISDTHGLLRPEASTYLKGCDLIVHAGDIGGEKILDALRAIAPVIAVRGNNDTEPGAQRLGEFEFAHVGDMLLYVVHDRTDIGIDLRAQGVGVVILGHSHKPLLERQDGMLFVNPGSAGRRRFNLPVAIGELRIEPGRLTAEIVNLLDGSSIAKIP